MRWRTFADSLIFGLPACIIGIVGAKPILSDINPITNLAPALASQNNSQTFSNASNVSASQVTIECDEEYGTNPNLADCESAIRRINPIQKILTFGDREDPELAADAIHLPFREMGDAALCYIQPVLMPSARFAKASLAEIYRAANDLKDKCVLIRGKGGRATGIGRAGNLALFLGSYHPSITCRGNLPRWQACNAVLYRMEAITYLQFFGPPTNPRSQVILPATVAADDGACVLRVATTKSVDIVSWYTLWEAATAVYAKCARHGQGGFFRGLGEDHDLVLSLSQSSGLAAGNSSNSVGIEQE